MNSCLKTILKIALHEERSRLGYPSWEANWMDMSWLKFNS